MHGTCMQPPLLACMGPPGACAPVAEECGRLKLRPPMHANSFMGGPPRPSLGLHAEYELRPGPPLGMRDGRLHAMLRFVKKNCTLHAPPHIPRRTCTPPRTTLPPPVACRGTYLYSPYPPEEVEIFMALAEKGDWRMC